MKLEGLTINFLGDSITEGVGVADAKNIYHQRIKEKYGLEMAYNYGVSGTRIARQTVPAADNTKFDLTFELRAEVMNRNADAVVVFGGTNDYGHGDAPFGEKDSTNIHTFCGAVNSLINKLKKDFPDAKIIFMTPLHRLNEENPSQPDGKTLKDYAAALREICAKHDTPVIDLFEINPLDPADGSVVPDGLHPNDNGHAVMAEVIGEALLKI